jgi:hypothetical protein
MTLVPYMGHGHKTEMEQESPGLRRKVRVMVFHEEMYSIQHYVIKFVSDLQQVSGFSSARVLRFPPLIKLNATI